MPRTLFLIVDQDGRQLGTLKALRTDWQPGERLVVRSTSYRISAVVPLDPTDPSGVTATLVVTPDHDDPAG